MSKFDNPGNAFDLHVDDTAISMRRFGTEIKFGLVFPGGYKVVSLNAWQAELIGTRLLAASQLADTEI